jgi:hypothetical protein
MGSASGYCLMFLRGRAAAVGHASSHAGCGFGGWGRVGWRASSQRRMEDAAERRQQLGAGW